jgi:4-hydroxybenzoyl-CoA reductase subunit beta
MHLDPFELHRPTTVEEAVACYRTHAGDVDYVAGGTDLLPNYKMHLNLRRHLISLDGVPELDGIAVERLGAMVRLARLEESRPTAEAYPGLVGAVREVATPLVRESGTVGGNLLLETRCFFFNQSEFWRASLGYCLKADGDACHVVPQKERCYATFSGDLAPALAVLDAEVEVAGANGRRRLPLVNLYDRAGDGIRRHTIAPGELLVAVHLPPWARERRATYLKLRVRPAFDFPELGVAAAARFDGVSVSELRLAVGGLEMAPRRFDDLTTSLLGQPLSEERIRTLAEAVTRAVRPVHNTFLPPDYRRRMTGVFVRRALEELRTRGAAG